MQPPPGFMPEHAIQHLRVSVIFMNKHVGFFHVTLQNGQLQFYQPEGLLAQLDGVKKKKSALNLLRQSFPLNIECLEEGLAAVPNFCAELTQHPAYLIYNPQEETVNLFFNAHYFKKPKLNDTLDFIPNSTSDWSYLNKMGATGSFSTDEPFSLSQIYTSLPNYYNFYSNNIWAYRNSSLIANLSQNNGINDGQRFQIQNLYAQGILRDKVYSAGYILNPNSPFFQTQIIAGVGVKTTLDTVKNKEEMLATPLVIFIPQASQVSIFKNEQLIFSQYLPAGYQNINTYGFPEGSYELLIKIGANNVVNRVFTKGFSLPPVQAPQFYLLGGYLTNGMIFNGNDYTFLPKTLNIPVVQTGLNKRVSERSALFGDLLLQSNQALFDFGSTFYLGNSFIRAAGLVTTRNDYGIYTMLNTQKRRLNLSLIATKIFYQDRRRQYFFLNNLIDNNSVSLSYRLSERDLVGVQGNYNRNFVQSNCYAYNSDCYDYVWHNIYEVAPTRSFNVGTFYQRFLGNYQGMGFYFNAVYNKAIFIGDSYYLSLSMNFSLERLAGTEALLWQQQNKSYYQDQLALPVVAQGSTTYSGQNDVGLGHSLNEIHTLSPTVVNLGGTYNYTASQAFASTYLSYNKIRGENATMGYGGSLETELAWNRNGAYFNGVRRGNASGILARVVSSDPKDNRARFALLDANNQKIAVIPANKKVFVPLPAFTDRNYTLVNNSNTDYYIHEPTRHMTLYPGNIGNYTWAVERRVIVIGRLMSRDRSPLSNVWLHLGQNGIFSDADGYFQLELAQNTRILNTKNFGGCQIQLPQLNADKAYFYVGEVSCT